MSKRIQAMIDELESPRKELSPWERQFVESVSDQFTRRGFLSEKQEETLQKIHEEKA
jgi:hypothetical protein